MNTPTLTGTYTCTHHNDAERTACPVCLVTALTAERDELRAENSDLKATDTRPLLVGTLTHAGFCRIGEEQLDGVFISIDREQIKALRHLPMYQQIELRVAATKEGEK
jgi:hypothetical protein